MKENYTDSSSKPKSHYTKEFGERITFKSLSEEFETFDRHKAIYESVGEATIAIKDLTKVVKDATSSMSLVFSTLEKNSTSMDKAISSLVEMAADFRAFLKNSINICLFIGLAYLWKIYN